MAKNVNVTWTDPTPITYVDHLEIWRKLGVGGTYAQIGTDINLGVEVYLDTNGGGGLDYGATYFYSVRAYNAVNAYSEIESSIEISPEFPWIDTPASIPDYVFHSQNSPNTIKAISETTDVEIWTKDWRVKMGWRMYEALGLHTVMGQQKGDGVTGPGWMIYDEASGLSLKYYDVTNKLATLKLGDKPVLDAWNSLALEFNFTSKDLVIMYNDTKTTVNMIDVNSNVGSAPIFFGNIAGLNEHSLIDVGYFENDYGVYNFVNGAGSITNGVTTNTLTFAGSAAVGDAWVSK